ncbi:MAG: asparagine synthase (glutamine-hydrolyzing) [Thiotrichales bacterium]|jgi:asparagine synthase (glutamine-hydrolysing)|nr:asparagine synthase (glutamine-hydrolyzing) [Thiotrichales bacterium]
MCGFAGFIDPRLASSDDRLQQVAAQMNARIAHRGPDAAGAWSDAQFGVALGHRRLAIMDLSPAGQQPMCSHCGRYVMIFNGEVYNHHQLRTRLAAEGVTPVWRGHSDTEVMLEAIAHWGVEAAITHFNGMFAFALWDRKLNCLTLARDRLGEKPLSYGWVQGVFFFASTVDACRAHPDFIAEIDPSVQALFLRYGSVPAPYNIFKGMHKLLPGQLLTLSYEDIQLKRAPNAHYYWHPRLRVEQALQQPFVGSDAQAIDALDTLLKDAVALRMEADVPLGAFLSGGFDSSLVAALMQGASAQQVQTFSIGFDAAKFDETVHARAVAKHLQTAHTELFVTAQDALEVIPKLVDIYDEPFADASAMPTYLVSKLTRQHVTVALSGDGGDELFGGYGHYATGEKLWNLVGGNLPSLLSLGAGALHSLPPSLLNRFGGLVGKPNVGDQLAKLGDLLPYFDTHSNAYRGLVSHWRDMKALMPEVQEPITLLTGLEALPSGDWTMDALMQYLDMRTYMSDDILTKVDRASMAVSLEGRIPLLDHRVAEFAWSLPQHMKRRAGVGKWILKELTYRYIPRAIMDRPKQGFAVPLAQWLRGDLRDWAESLLTVERLEALGLNAVLVRRAWQAHLSGQRDFKTPLWTVLMLLQFQQHNVS